MIAEIGCNWFTQRWWDPQRGARRLVCGIAIGSTSLKVGLADGAGGLHRAEIVPTPRRRGAFGIVAASRHLLEKVETLILPVWRQAGHGVRITAICTTSVSEGGQLDAHLRPLAPVIPWFDRRARAEADLNRASTAATTRAGIAMNPTRTGVKWRWLTRFPKIGAVLGANDPTAIGAELAAKRFNRTAMIFGEVDGAQQQEGTLLIASVTQDPYGMSKQPAGLGLTPMPDVALPEILPETEPVTRNNVAPWIRRVTE